MKLTTVVVGFLVALLSSVEATGKYKGLEFIDSCSQQDPELEACLARAANSLANNFRHGEFILFCFFFPRISAFV